MKISRAQQGFQKRWNEKSGVTKHRKEKDSAGFCWDGFMEKLINF